MCRSTTHRCITRRAGHIPHSPAIPVRTRDILSSPGAGRRRRPVARVATRTTAVASCRVPVVCRPKSGRLVPVPFVAFLNFRWARRSDPLEASWCAARVAGICARRGFARASVSLRNCADDGSLADVFLWVQLQHRRPFPRRRRRRPHEPDCQYPSCGAIILWLIGC